MFTLRVRKAEISEDVAIPSLTRTVWVFFISVLPFSVVFFCRSESLFYEIDFPLRGGGVQHVNRVPQTRGINDPKGVAFAGYYDL